MPALVAVSRQMQHVLREARLFAPFPRPIVLIGPTGVGKGTLAHFIHAESGRTGELVTLDGGQLTPGLLHSQLYGHDRGAFTGATSRNPGALALAAGGTLFIDELPLWDTTAQAAMLRPLAEGRFQALGTARDLDVTARVVVGSTKPLETLEGEGRLLRDLRYRIEFVQITIPPLCERRADLLHLASAALEAARTAFRLELPMGFGATAVQSLLRREWPGNAREVRYSVEEGAIRANGEGSLLLEKRHLNQAPEPMPWYEGAEPEVKKAAARWALGQTGGQRGAAAELLGIHRNTIRKVLDDPVHEAGAEGVVSDTSPRHCDPGLTALPSWRHAHGDPLNAPLEPR